MLFWNALQYLLLSLTMNFFSHFFHSKWEEYCIARFLMYSFAAGTKTIVSPYSNRSGGNLHRHLVRTEFTRWCWILANREDTPIYRKHHFHHYQSDTNDFGLWWCRMLSEKWRSSIAVGKSKTARLQEMTSTEVALGYNLIKGEI